MAACDIGSNFKKRKFSSMDDNKVFNDAIHGTIELHPLCVKIIDTPQLQRLRFLKQVGSCYFVFHCAAHNRFEHCIGVCHLAGQLVEALQSRQPELNITEQDVICVKIAGLCHDLGHGPFSHLWDNFLKRTRPHVEWRHEVSSAVMFDYLIESNGLRDHFQAYGLSENDFIFIKEMITINDELENSQWTLKGRSQSKSFLYEIVANKRTGVDVDKWDYVLRDGHSLGVKVMFDYNRLIQFSRVIRSAAGLQICYREKEVNSIYDMFYIRKMLHRIAYQHKVVKIIDAMLIDALCLADEHITYEAKDGTRLPLRKVIDDPFAFTHLTDDVINSIYQSSLKHDDIVQAKALIHRIYTRDLYKTVGQTDPTSENIDPGLLLTKMKRVEPDLKLNEMEVLSTNFDYGMGSMNPINSCRFFTKRDINVCYIIRSDSASIMHPKNFQEKSFLVISKTGNAESSDSIEFAFRCACEELDLKITSMACPSHNLTPEK